MPIFLTHPVISSPILKIGLLFSLNLQLSVLVVYEYLHKTSSNYLFFISFLLHYFLLNYTMYLEKVKVSSARN